MTEPEGEWVSDKEWWGKSIPPQQKDGAMSDITITALVKRLRFHAPAIHSDLLEAADALEALQAGNDDLVKTIEVLQERYAALQARAEAALALSG